MSTLNVTNLAGRGGNTPNLPDGAVISGINTIDASGIKVGNGIVLASGGALTATTGTFNGNVSATAFAGNGANLTNLPAQSPVITGIASGTIPANRAVCVYSDGKVGLVTGTTLSWGPILQAGPSIEAMQYVDMAYGNGKVFINIKSPGNSGRCLAGTINADRTITWGAWNEYEGTISGKPRVVYMANEDKFAIGYYRSSATKARVATVTGNTISYSTESEVKGATPESLEMAYDPDTSQVIFVYKQGNNNSYSKLGAMNGSGALSYGSEVQMSGNNSNGPVGVCYDTKNNKVIIAVGYNGDQSNNGWAFVGTVSGTGYAGNAVTSAGLINYNYQHSRISMLYDEERDRIVFASFNGNNQQWESLVGKYVSDSSITWGDVDIIEKYSGAYGGYNSLAYDPYGKIYVLIYNNSSGDLVNYQRGKINPVGSSEPERMTWSDKRQLFKGNYGAVANTTAGDAIVFAYGADSSYTIKTRVEGLRNSTLSYDGGNYIGYSAAAYTDGQTVTIQVVGNISTQVGLTPGLEYYIQGDGGLASFKDPNIPSYTVAGTALDATKLLIK